MASRKTLKKDITFVTNSIITRAFFCISYTNSPKESIIPIIEDTIELRKELLEKASALKLDKSKNIKKQYNKLLDELVKKANELIVSLNKIG